MRNNLRVRNMVHRQSGLSLSFYNDNLFKVNIDNPLSLSFQDLIRANSFSRVLPIHKTLPQHIQIFESEFPKIVKYGKLDLYFFRSLTKQDDEEKKECRLDRNNMIDLHIANEIIGYPILQLYLNVLDKDLAKDFPSTAFWGNKNGFYHTTTHYSSLKRRVLEFNQCDNLFHSDESQWFCGIDKHLSPKTFDFYKK